MPDTLRHFLRRLAQQRNEHTISIEELSGQHGSSYHRSTMFLAATRSRFQIDEGAV